MAAQEHYLEGTVEPYDVQDSAVGLSNLENVFPIMCTFCANTPTDNITLKMSPEADATMQAAFHVFRILAIYARMSTADDGRDYFGAFKAQFDVLVPREEDRCKCLALVKGFLHEWLRTMIGLYSGEQQEGQDMDEAQVPVV